MKINIYKKVALSFIMVTGLFSCSDFLDEEPRSNLSPDFFYQDASQVTSAIIGIYDVLDNAEMHGQQGLIAIGDLAADILHTGGSNMVSKTENPPSYEIDPGNTRILDFYNSNYNLIMRANTVISRVDKSLLDAEEKQAFIAEAKFLRAYSYFNMVRVFGDIVLITDETVELENLAQPKSTAGDVYDVILNDLLDAETGLGDAPAAQGRAHKWAAKALLAKVYLTVGDASNAAIKTGEIINSGQGFGLHTAYNELFRPENDELTNEILFAVNYGLQRRNILTDFLTPAEVSAYNAFRAYDTLFNYDSYELNDLRREQTIYDSIVWKGEWLDPNGIMFIKFAEEHLYDEIPEGQSGTYNYPILRYADVLLMHAEAQNEINNGPNDDAYDAINLVRDRAGLPPLAGLDYEQFKDAIAQERKVEFALEGHRWFDLKRFGRLSEVMSFFTDWDPRYQFFPIPESALTANDELIQNPDYE